MPRISVQDDVRANLYATWASQHMHAVKMIPKSEFFLFYPFIGLISLIIKFAFD